MFDLEYDSHIQVFISIVISAAHIQFLLMLIIYADNKRPKRSLLSGQIINIEVFFCNAYYLCE